MMMRMMMRMMIMMVMMLLKCHNEIYQSDKNQLNHNNDVQSTFIIETYHVFQLPEKTKNEPKIKKKNWELSEGCQ